MKRKNLILLGLAVLIYVYAFVIHDGIILTNQQACEWKQGILSAGDATLKKKQENGWTEEQCHHFYKEQIKKRKLDKLHLCILP